MPYINVDEAYILDNTGLQVDMTTDLPFADAGLNETQQAQARKNIAAGGTNPNLIDNPFFTIRQRGDGPFTGNVYGLDRWRGGNSRTTITGNSGYITVATNTSGNGILRQILSQTYEGTYTFSAVVGGSGSGALFFQDGGGTIIGDASEFTTTGDTQLVTLTFTTSGTAIGGVAVRVDVSNTIDVVCAKLEKGTVSTLANDVPPDYGTELAKCQRYFIRLSNTTNYAVFGTGHAASASVVYVFVPLPVTMRTSPAKSISTVGDFRLIGNGQTVSMTDIGVRIATENGVTLQTSGSTGLTTYQTYSLVNTGVTAYIDLSADL